jgi:hypothetical protein
MKKTLPKTEEEMADRFDAGEDLESLGFDVKNAQVEQPRLKRVNVDFPEPMLAMLDRDGELRGINRQALIKTWLLRKTARCRGLSSTPSANDTSKTQRSRFALEISEHRLHCFRHPVVMLEHTAARHQFPSGRQPQPTIRRDH